MFERRVTVDLSHKTQDAPDKVACCSCHQCILPASAAVLQESYHIRALACVALCMNFKTSVCKSGNFFFLLVLQAGPSGI